MSLGQSYLDPEIQTHVSPAERKVHHAFLRTFGRCCVSYLRTNFSSDLVELNIFSEINLEGCFSFRLVIIIKD